MYRVVKVHVDMSMRNSLPSYQVPCCAIKGYSYMIISASGQSSNINVCEGHQEIEVSCYYSVELRACCGLSSCAHVVAYIFVVEGSQCCAGTVETADAKEKTCG